MRSPYVRICAQLVKHTRVAISSLYYIQAYAPRNKIVKWQSERRHHRRIKDRMKAPFECQFTFKPASPAPAATTSSSSVQSTRITSGGGQFANHPVRKIVCTPSEREYQNSRTNVQGLFFLFCISLLLD